MTIAGQTAPGDGILIRGAEVQTVGTHDVIIRHLRVRAGPMSDVGPSSLGGLENSRSHDVIFDHCSVSWGPDDMIGAGNYDAGTSEAYNVTYQWCIVTEGLGHQESSGFDPGKIGIVADYVDSTAQFSLLHNLFANTTYRIPNIAAGSVQLVNNVIYNTVSGTQLMPIRSRISAEFVNNVYQRGPDTDSWRELEPAIDIYECDPSGFDCSSTAGSEIYVHGNYHETLRPDETYPEDSFVLTRISYGNPVGIRTTPFGIFPVISDQTSAQQARADVLGKAGARVPTLDSVDQRSINDVIDGTGRIITDPVQVGGYPVYDSGTPYPDGDFDGMDDNWETDHGLNPKSASDGPATAPNGYTNLENFLNALAGDPI